MGGLGRDVGALSADRRCAGYGRFVRPRAAARQPRRTDDATPVEDASFDNLVKRWFPLTNVLNSLNRSVGVTDGYPFALATPVIDKLRFVHRVIASHVVKGVP